MPKGTNQKLKLFYLLKIMLEKTDEDHRVTVNEILAELEKYDVTAERKTIYKDMEALEVMDIEIESEKEGRSNYYHVTNRPFELPELKLLVDAIQSSKFITEKKSNELIKKLENLVSKYEARELQRQVYVSGRIKTMNESIYYNVDAIHTAIAENKKIIFQYFQWNVKKEMELRHDGKFYHISPWGLSWDDENYYLVGFDSEAGIIKHYRVDKMKNILIENKVREGREKLKKLDIASYGKSKFGMYNGEEIKAEILCKNSAIGVLIDRFGTDVTILKKDEAHSRVFVKVADNKLFIHWIMAMGDNFKIIGPENLVKEVHDELNRLAKQYELAD